jgi:FkbM family methyltransferase
MKYETWLRPYVPAKGDIFIDVGAGRGDWTAGLAARFRYGYAIELNPEILPELRALALTNVKIEEWGAWDEEGERVFSYCLGPDVLNVFEEMGAPLQKRLGPPKSTLKCAVRPLDSLTLEGKLDFMKIDTEGAEVHVVLGAKGLIGLHRPRLLIEIHSAKNFRRLRDLLLDWGYIYTTIGDPNFSRDPVYGAEYFWIAAKPEILK